MKDLTNQKFGKLRVTKLKEVRKYKSPKNQQTKAYWYCLCDCGMPKVVRGEHLTSGRTVSCGCVAKNNATTHGLSKSTEYKSWMNMRHRILNPDKLHQKYYADIGYAEEWDSFETFLKDMGHKPSPKHEIDRIDPSLPYCKENCRWATRSEQMLNTRRHYT